MTAHRHSTFVSLIQRYVFLGRREVLRIRCRRSTNCYETVCTRSPERDLMMPCEASLVPHGALSGFPNARVVYLWSMPAFQRCGSLGPIF